MKDILLLPNLLLVLVSLSILHLTAGRRFNASDQLNTAVSPMADKSLNLFFELGYDCEDIKVTASLKWLSDLTENSPADIPSSALPASRTDVRWNQTGWFYEFCQVKGRQLVVSGAVTLQQVCSGVMRAYPASESGSFSLTIDKPSTSFASCQRFATVFTSVPVVGEKIPSNVNGLVWSELQPRNSNIDYAIGGVLVSLLLHSTPAFIKQKSDRYLCNGKQFFKEARLSEPLLTLVCRNHGGSEFSRVLPREISHFFLQEKSEYRNCGNQFQPRQSPVASGPLQTIRRCFSVLTAGEEPVEGGGRSQSSSGSSKHSASSSQKQLGKREATGARPSAVKKKKLSSGEGGGDQGGQQQEDSPKTLTEKQRVSELNQRLLLDMAWNIKENFELLKHASGYYAHITDRLPGGSIYGRTFYLLRTLIEKQKMEHVCQLIEHFNDPRYQQLQSKLIDAIIAFREEHVSVGGTYSDLHSRVILRKTKLITEEVARDHILGLHLGLTPLQIPFRDNLRVFTKYKTLHPNIFLSTFLPRLRKGLTRINKASLYDEIVTCYTSSLLVKKQKKQAAHDRKDTNKGLLKDSVEKEEPIREDVTLSFASSLGSFVISPELPALPASMLHHVFCFLDLKSLARCREVSHVFRESLDDLQLHAMHPAITQYTGTDYHYHNEERKRVKSQIWFKCLDWYEILEKQGTNPEIIRRCKTDTYLLQQVLKKAHQAYILKHILCDTRKYALPIHTIRTNYPHCPNNSPVSALALGDKMMAPLRIGGYPLKVVCELRVDTKRHGQWRGTGLFINFQDVAVSLLDDQLYLTTGYSKRLSLWDFSRQKKECLVKSCDVTKHVFDLAAIKLETGTVVIISYSTIELAVWDIDTTGQEETFSLVSSLNLKAKVRKLLALNNAGNRLLSLDEDMDNPANLGLFELDSQKVLTKVCSRPAISAGEISKHDKIYSSLRFAQCGDIILVLVRSGYFVGWSLDISHCLFTKNDHCCLSDGYSFFNLVIFSDNRFAIIIGSDLYRFKIVEGQLQGEPQKLKVDLFLAHKTWGKSIAAVSEDLILLGDSNGGISLWWVPEHDSQP